MVNQLCWNKGEKIPFSKISNRQIDFEKVFIKSIIKVSSTTDIPRERCNITSQWNIYELCCMNISFTLTLHLVGKFERIIFGVRNLNTYFNSPRILRILTGSYDRISKIWNSGKNKKVSSRREDVQQKRKKSERNSLFCPVVSFLADN